jgi:hypothetical protein
LGGHLIGAIDPLIGHTTPLQVLAQLARFFDIPRKASQRIWPSGDSQFASNNRGRNVSIQNNSIENTFIISGQEGEDEYALWRDLADFIATRPKLDEYVVVFLDCHHVDSAGRQVLFHRVWKNLIGTISALGARVVFQYSPDLDQRLEVLPAPATRRIRLPLTLSSAVVPEIAAHVLAEGWETSPDKADHMAEVVLDLSESVEDVYGHLLVRKAKAVSEL